MDASFIGSFNSKEMNDAGYPWVELIFGKTMCLSLLSESVIIGCQ